MTDSKKLLIVHVAGLSVDIARELKMDGLAWQAMDAVFPAVTCTAQASFRTAAAPNVHGMIANGLYDRRLRKAMFWEQSSALVAGDRIWSSARAAGKRVAMLFWQQSMGEDVDVVLSPAPIHKHHGGMIQDCYGQPPGLYGRLCERIGGPFALKHYWGPAASPRVGDWIAPATAAVLADEQLSVDVCLSYLPTLDYDFQRFGPADARCGAAIEKLTVQLSSLAEAAAAAGAEMVVFGDYAIADVTAAPVYPNRALAAAGLLSIRNVRGMEYVDLHASKAFAMVDHEVAHVYARDGGAAAEVLSELPGVEMVMDRRAQTAARVNHANSGELMLLAAEGSWLAYPWWTEDRRAPDYARHVDIHNKPGFDPCELFWRWLPPGVDTDATRVRGTHGRVGPGREVAWATTTDMPQPVSNLVELGKAVSVYIGR